MCPDRVFVAALVLLLASCGGNDEGRSGDADSVAAVASEASPPGASTVQSGGASGMAADSAAPCPATGRWAPCSLETRLRRSGFVARRAVEEVPRRAGFSVSPVVYTLGRGRLEAFIYEDDALLARDIAALDTLAVTPKGSTGDWPSPPGFVRSGNLIAVFMDQTARQAERLVLAISAGAPMAR